MSSSKHNMGGLIDQIASQHIHSLNFPNNQKINICVFYLRAVKINSLSISPQVHTFKVVILSRREISESKFAIDFNLIKHLPSCLRFNDDPQLGKVSIFFQFQMIHLMLLVPKHKPRGASQFDMFQIGPISIKLILAGRLTLDDDQNNGVLL